MAFGLRILTQPSVEPVTIELAKQQCRLESTFTDDDALIAAYIMAARSYVENVTHRVIYNQQWLMTLDNFPFYNYASGTAPTGPRADALYNNFWRGMEIKLPKPTCVSVDSITYLDFTYTPQTLDPILYKVDANSEPARITPLFGTTWPTTVQYTPGSIQVTFTSGTYGDGVTIDNCPQNIKLAILLMVGHWYEHREAVSELNLKSIPLAIDSLLASEVFTCFSLEAN